MIFLLILAQSTGLDPISGGAGWIGAGLLGAVLCWLLLVHLPAKDKQIKELTTEHATAMKEVSKSNEAAIKELTREFSKNLKVVADECEGAHDKNRETSERHHNDVVAALNRIHETTREGVHATRNLQNTIVVRQRLADAFQSTEMPAWTKALDGTVTSWNTAAERLLGWKQGEVVGRSIHERLLPPYRREEELRILQSISDGQAVDEYETERMHKSGYPVRIVAVTSPIRDQSGKIVGASTIARDAS